MPVLGSRGKILAMPGGKTDRLQNAKATAEPGCVTDIVAGNVGSQKLSAKSDGLMRNILIRGRRTTK
jgi:hypothetical protein